MNEAVRVTVLEVKGSAPRGPGTSMTICATGQSGTIGGGALEWEATRIAQDMLTKGRTHDQRTFPLGPSLGQCCGGSVVLEFSTLPPEDVLALTQLWIWGAGHVGRAVAGVVAPLDEYAVTLIDTSPDRLPETLPETVTSVVAKDMPRLAAHAPQGAHHLIVTYSHDIDLSLCDALLKLETGPIGLIGSATKWARFANRLALIGYKATDIARITCPVGDPALGKHPHAIAVGVASGLLKTGTFGGNHA